MPNNNTDVFLRLILDQLENAKLQTGILKDEAVLAGLEGQIEELAKKWNESGGKIIQTNKEISRSLTAEARVMRREAAAIVDDLKARQISTLNQLSGMVGGLSRGALVTGGGILGGAFLEVNKYVNDAKEATAITRAWKQETDSLAKSRARVDEVLAREALPMLRQAARYANEAAAFVEQHPEIVQAVLNTGKILVGIGIIGTVLSKGIKLIADISWITTIGTQLSAAKLQNVAADKQLAAAQARLKDLGVPGGSVTQAGTNWVGMAGLIVGGLIASGAAVTLVNYLLERSGINDKIDVARNQARNVNARIYPGLINNPEERRLQVELNKAIVKGNVEEIARLRNEIDNLGNAAQQTGQMVGMALSRLAGSENEQAVVAAFTKWQEDDRRLIEEAAENRRDIIAKAEKQIADITRKYAAQRVDINKQFDKSRAELIQNFSESSRQAEINYAQARANIIKDTGEEIQRIEEQHQENIRKMTLEHNQRVEDLTASRDALGLVKEQRRFDQDLAESERETNQQIAQRRRDTAIRLQELAVEFAVERAQRLAQFEQNLAENEERRQEELKEAAVAHQAELKQIREQRAAQLRELQEGLNAERLRRREVFIAEIRDLDSALLGERNLKAKYYNLMLADAEKWLAAYRAKLAGSTGTTGGSIPTRDAGGYAERGIYRIAWNGAREFVMSGQTTRAAERVIGGQLTQQSLMRAIASGRGNVTWNDHRRFDSRLSLADRDAILEDTKQILMQEFS
jgi:hypothetical protein